MQSGHGQLVLCLRLSRIHQDGVSKDHKLPCNKTRQKTTEKCVRNLGRQANIGFLTPISHSKRLPSYENYFASTEINPSRFGARLTIKWQTYVFFSKLCVTFPLVDFEILTSNLCLPLFPPICYASSEVRLAVATLKRWKLRE